MIFTILVYFIKQQENNHTERVLVTSGPDDRLNHADVVYRSVREHWHAEATSPTLLRYSAGEDRHSFILLEQWQLHLKGGTNAAFYVCRLWLRL